MVTTLNTDKFVNFKTDPHATHVAIVKVLFTLEYWNLQHERINKMSSIIINHTEVFSSKVKLILNFQSVRVSFDAGYMSAFPPSLAI